MFFRLLGLIDNGRFFITPLKWWYIFKGCVAWLIPLAFVGFLIVQWDDVKMMLDMSNAWTSIVGIVMLILFTCVLGLLAYLTMQFWFHRKRRLDTLLHEDNSVVAIPLVVDNFQNNAEWASLFLSLSTICGSVLLLVFFILTGALDFYQGNFILMLFGIIVVDLVVVLISWFSLLFVHFLAEQLRMIPEICNNLRDVADIHRAATIIQRPKSVQQ